MKHIQTAVLWAGAQETCAVSMEKSLHGLGAIANQPEFTPIRRRDLMNAVNVCGKDLGLSQGDLVVLDALLSCLAVSGNQGEDQPLNRSVLLTVYASNETLAFRAKGISDRQLRRNLVNLEARGLILRRDSSNGKRYPIKQAGNVVGAYGIDLSPLLSKSEDLVHASMRKRQEDEELKGLRAQLLWIRNRVLAVTQDETLIAAATTLRNLTRRASFCLTEACRLLTEWSAVHAALSGPQECFEPSKATSAEALTMDAPTASECPLPCTVPKLELETELETDIMAASDGHTVRHIDPDSDSKKRIYRPKELSWSELSNLSELYEEPRTEQDFRRVLFGFGQMLRVSQNTLVRGLTCLEPMAFLNLLEQLSNRIDDIKSSDAYLMSIIRGSDRSQFNHSEYRTC